MHAALLAPVPEEHLKDGIKTAKEHGKAAYGSRKYDVFHRLDQLRDGEPVPVYIYASHPEQPVGPKVTWEGLYVGFVPAAGLGRYPDDMKYRPPSATKHPDDVAGHWLIYWHVSKLKRLDEDDWISIADICRYKTQKPYGEGFVPEGPIIVGHP